MGYPTRPFLDGWEDLEHWHRGQSAAFAEPRTCHSALQISEPRTSPHFAIDSGNNCRLPRLMADSVNLRRDSPFRYGVSSGTGKRGHVGGQVTCPRSIKNARTRSRARDRIQPCHSCEPTGSLSKASTRKMPWYTLSQLGAKVIGFTVHAFASQGRQFLPTRPPCEAESRQHGISRRLYAGVGQTLEVVLVDRLRFGRRR